MNRKRRWLALVLAATGMVLVALWLRPAPLTVATATVDRGPLTVVVQEQGKTRARHRYVVAAPITGRVLRLQVDEGDQVQAGAVLARMAPPPEDRRTEATLQSQVAAAEARSHEATAHLQEMVSLAERAELEAERRGELYKKKLVSLEERDLYAQAARSAEAQLETAEAAVRAAEADVASAKARLLGIGVRVAESALEPVVAPVSGSVLRVFEESERVVSAGAPLVELSADDALEVVIDLLTQDAVKVAPGDRMRITGWGGEQTLTGLVRYIEPGGFTKISTLGVEEQRVNVIGDLIDPPATLGAGFRVEAAIEIWQSSDALRIPTSAIFRREGGWWTFVLAGDRAELREIEIGRRSTEYAQVLGGIDAGDMVVQYPSDLVGDGVRVQPGN